MSAALLLIAAALCVAPWRGTAAGRLPALGLAPGPTSGSGAGPAPGPDAGRGRPPAAAWAPWAPWVARTLDRVRPGGRSPEPTGSPARMLDLLAAALNAGLPVHLALAAVGDAVAPVDPGLSAALRSVAARVRLGATPDEAWRGVPSGDRLAPVASVLARAPDAGGSVRSALGHAARRVRSEADAAATARAERAAVLVAGPLGLCFLPAFICLGVLPVVVGLADGMLPGMLP